MVDFIKKVTQSATILAASPEDSALGCAMANDVCDTIRLIVPYALIKRDKFHYLHTPNPQVLKSVIMPQCPCPTKRNGFV
jgi:hypothetical protein